MIKEILFVDVYLLNLFGLTLIADYDYLAWLGFLFGFPCHFFLNLLNLLDRGEADYKLKTD